MRVRIRRGIRMAKKKSKQSEGQATLEFLATYGWCFIVILIVIGTFAYFGILSQVNKEDFIKIEGSEQCNEMKTKMQPRVYTCNQIREALYLDVKLPSNKETQVNYCTHLEKNGRGELRIVPYEEEVWNLPIYVNLEKEFIKKCVDGE